MVNDYYQRRRKVYQDLILTKEAIYWYKIKSVLNRARNLYIDDIPLSLYLLDKDYVSGNCYVCSFLLGKIFEDLEFNLLLAEINGLRYLYETKREFDDDIHSFLVVTFNQKDYVVDSVNLGLLVPKDVYFELENPTIKLNLDKRKVLRKSARGFTRDVVSKERLKEYLERILKTEIVQKEVYREVIYQRARLNNKFG